MRRRRELGVAMAKSPAAVFGLLHSLKAKPLKLSELVADGVANDIGG